MRYVMSRTESEVNHGCLTHAGAMVFLCLFAEEAEFWRNGS